MIETGSEYQLLQHFEALPVQAADSDETPSDGTAAGTSTAIPIDMRAVEETKAAVAKLVDGSKFETFLEALVNIIVVIPVKYVNWQRFVYVFGFPPPLLS